MDDPYIDAEISRLDAEERQAVARLAEVEYLIETNQGTYSAAEAGQKVGCGETHFADRNVYETVGGVRRETGPSEADAPGRMIRLKKNCEALASLRKSLARMRKDLSR